MAERWGAEFDAPKQVGLALDGRGEVVSLAPSRPNEVAHAAEPIEAEGDLWRSVVALLRRQWGTAFEASPASTVAIETDARTGSVAMLARDRQEVAVLERSWRAQVEQAVRAVSGRDYRVRVRHPASQAQAVAA